MIEETYAPPQSDTDQKGQQPHLSRAERNRLKIEERRAAAEAKVNEKRSQVDAKKEKGGEAWNNFTGAASNALSGIRERAGRIKDRASGAGEKVAANVAAAPDKAGEVWTRAVTALELKLMEAFDKVNQLDDRAEEWAANKINAAAGRLESVVISGSARWKEFRAEQQRQAADRARNALNKKMEARQRQAQALREQAARILQQADQIEQTPGSSEAGLAERADKLTVSSGETRDAADAARTEAADRKVNAKSVSRLVGYLKRNQ